MEIRQRNIVFVEFNVLPEGKQKHPCLIISNSDVHSKEDFFVGVMLSATPKDDIFSHWFGDTDFVSQPEWKTQARCHIIQAFMKSDVIEDNRPLRLKREPFERVLDKIYDFVISTD